LNLGIVDEKKIEFDENWKIDCLHA
jgi:hypothetical protein